MHVCECARACVGGRADERLGSADGRAARGRSTKRAHARQTNTDPITRILNKQGRIFSRKETKNREELRTSGNNRCGRASFHHSCSAVLTLLLPAHPALRSRRRRPNLSPPKDLVRVQVQVRGGSRVIEPLLKLLPGCSCFLFHFLFCLFSSDWLLFILV